MVHLNVIMRRRASRKRTLTVCCKIRRSSGVSIQLASRSLRGWRNHINLRRESHLTANCCLRSMLFTCRSADIVAALVERTSVWTARPCHITPERRVKNIRSRSQKCGASIAILSYLGEAHRKKLAAHQKTASVGRTRPVANVCLAVTSNRVTPCQRMLILTWPVQL